MLLALPLAGMVAVAFLLTWGDDGPQRIEAGPRRRVSRWPARRHRWPLAGLHAR
jgi:hypothetical protein